ncbi:MAG: ABC transporter permease [Bacillota bacterium]|nr:ABC transporter permease [Bacillota bacterium]
MKPLSAFAFIKGSIPKLLPMAITVCLAVAVLYFMAMFTQQINTGVEEAGIYPLEKMSLILGDKSGVSKDDINNIGKNISNSKIFVINPIDVTYYNIIGYTSAFIIMSGQKDIEPIMKMQNFKLIEGCLPQKPMEIVLNKKLAENYGFKLGTVIRKNTKGWRIEKDLKVVGIFEGRAVTGMGMEDESILKPRNPYISLLVGSDAGSLQPVNKYIEKNFSGKYQTLTLEAEKNTLNNFNGPINALELFIGLVLICVIGVFLSNITSIQYSLRRKELELLNAIGYTRKYIVKKALKEIAVAAGLGYIVGILLAVALGWGMNICFLSEKGMSFPLFLGGSMFSVLIVPAAIILFSIKAPLKLTKFRDLA